MNHLFLIRGRYFAPRPYERPRRGENAVFGKGETARPVCSLFFPTFSGDSKSVSTLHVARKRKQSASLVVRRELDDVQQKAVQHFSNRRTLEPER